MKPNQDDRRYDGDTASARGRAGRVWTQILLLLATLTLLVLALLHLLVQMRRTAGCADNLKSIYRALELHEMERGVLPTLAYFPDHPIEDSDSLRVVLEPYGIAAHRCICPQARTVQREEGLTYIWNVSLNGQRIPRGDEKTWMLVDMNALTEDVPAPHLGRYNVLYSDGTVQRLRKPLEALPGL